jgi:hypothetical protein
MSFLSSFLILFLAWTAHARIITDDNCGTYVNKLDTCMATISFSGNCPSNNVSLSNTEYANCTSNYFFWSYPLYNMTLTIETLFTHQHQHYTISLDNEELRGAISKVFRIINNEEKEVTTHDKTLIQNSDSNYQIILKFQGPTHLSRYGVNINYKTI